MTFSGILKIQRIIARAMLAKKTRPKTMMIGERGSHLPKRPAKPNRKTAAWISKRLDFRDIAKKI